MHPVNHGGLGLRYAGQLRHVPRVPRTDTWTLTVTGVPTANFQYKFTLGSWNNVEETGSCGYLNNRTFAFDTADQTYTANDTVAAWAGVGSC